MKKFSGLVLLSILFISCGNNTETATPSADTTATTQNTTSNEYEIADQKYINLAKKHTGFLESGDIDGWMADLSDDAIYRWNNFDSLTGRAAITDYWKKRRTEVIDSMSFTNDIWLPVKVNITQVPGHLTGNYALCWYTVTAKYKTGKSMKQRIHTVFHFNADDKVDRVYQYLDRVPVMAAMRK